MTALSRLVVPGLLLLTACGPGEEPVDPEALFQPGSDPVGYTVFEVEHDVPGQDDPRTVTAHVWYPAVDGGEGLATYEVAAIVSVPSDNALVDPAPADGGPYPVVVYSHGSGGEGQLGVPYGEHLASHGYVVIAPDHKGNTASDAVGGTSDGLLRISVNRPLDVSASLTAAADAVAGLDVDPETALVFGHSFGGYTTLAIGGAAYDLAALDAACPEGGPDPDGSCELLAESDVRAALESGFGDDRFDALVPQAPALFSLQASSFDGVQAPTLLQSGRRDQTTPHETQAVPTWEGLDHPGDVWNDLLDGGHYSFVTICEDVPRSTLNLFIDGIDDDGCGDDFTPVPEAVSLLSAYLHAFAEIHLRGETAWEPVLKGEPLRDFVDVTARTTVAEE